MLWFKYAFLVKGFLISWIGEQETLGIGSAHFD